MILACALETYRSSPENMMIPNQLADSLPSSKTSPFDPMAICRAESDASNTIGTLSAVSCTYSDSATEVGSATGGVGTNVEVGTSLGRGGMVGDAGTSVGKGVRLGGKGCKTRLRCVRWRRHLLSYLRTDCWCCLGCKRRNSRGWCLNFLRRCASEHENQNPNKKREAKGGHYWTPVMNSVCAINPAAKSDMQNDKWTGFSLVRRF